jgi:hypothetical protein
VTSGELHRSGPAHEPLEPGSTLWSERSFAPPVPFTAIGPRILPGMIAEDVARILERYQHRADADGLRIGRVTVTFLLEPA